MIEQLPEDNQNNVGNDIDTPGHFPVLQQCSVALGILILIFGTTYIGDVKDLITAKPEIKSETALAIDQPKINTERPDSNQFENVTIDARSAFVWDMREQRTLYSKNADEQLPLASITKLMTALVAYELLDQGQDISISAEAIHEDGDSGLSNGETFSSQDLTDLTLISSSNDGAHALAAGTEDSIFGSQANTDIFIRAMNIRAEQIGLPQTFFKNVTGLDLSETEAGAYSSARDITFLLEYILTHYPDLLSQTATYETTIENLDGEWHAIENTNPIVTDIPGLFASKTGFTELAGGNLTIAFDAGLNHPILITVLGSTLNGRFTDVQELAQRARKSILSNN